ncbi:MAG: DUF4190 domain-containing protein [Micromonosporaceae bacterium]
MQKQDDEARRQPEGLEQPSSSGSEQPASPADPPGAPPRPQSEEAEPGPQQALPQGEQPERAESGPQQAEPQPDQVPRTPNQWEPDGPGEPVSSPPQYTPAALGPPAAIRPPYQGHAPYGGQPGHPYPGPPGYPPYGYYYPPVRPTNGLAIASLVVSCCSVFVACLFYGLPGLLGAVGATLGHVAQNQMKQSGEQGRGLALAGIIVGWIMTGLAILIALAGGFAIWWAVTHDPGPGM